MRLSILCSNPKHPIIDSLRKWVEGMSENGHTTSIFFDKSELRGGDILFLVSCSQIINEDERKKFEKVLVLHASDLPKGRGWSPWVWTILAGESEITLSLLEATDSIDSGLIWLKTSFRLSGHELFEEINAKLFKAELYLMTQAVERYGEILPIPQVGQPGEYLRKRTPEDSRIDPRKSIEEQFNLLRVVDPQRYPAFFEYRGVKYFIKIEKIKNEKSN